MYVYSDNAKEVFSFISNNTNKNDVFVFFKPRLFYFETGRLAVWRYTANDLDYDYILHYKSKYKFPSLAELNKLVVEQKLSLVFNNDEFSLFKVLKNK